MLLVSSVFRYSQKFSGFKNGWFTINLVRLAVWCLNTACRAEYISIKQLFKIKPMKKKKNTAGTIITGIFFLLAFAGNAQYPRSILNTYQKKNIFEK